MQKKKLFLRTGMIVAFSICFSLSSFTVSASSTLLKKGMQGSDVAALQSDLKKLGFFSATATGYYGDITEASVKKLQKAYGYSQDGIAGEKTFGLIDRLLGNSSGTSSRGGASSTGSTVLKKGMRGSAVTVLQNNLKKLGFFSATATGYYGDITEASVKKLQKAYGYSQDGIAGEKTFGLIDRLLGNSGDTASRGAVERSSEKDLDYYMVKWFGGAENILSKGETATVYDVETGLSFKIMRTYGYNHADCEPLTAEDTKIMKKIYGGQWSWSRRAVIVTVDGRKMAASMAGMPHAGVDSAPKDEYVSSRSGGYGGGANLDTVKDNDMSGVFDLHFYGSKTHGTNKVDAAHQSMVKKAAEWAVKNL